MEKRCKLHLARTPGQYCFAAAEHPSEEECLLLRSSCCVVALADKSGLGLRDALS